MPARKHLHAPCTDPLAFASSLPSLISPEPPRLGLCCMLARSTQFPAETKRGWAIELRKREFDDPRWGAGLNTTRVP